MNHNKKLTAIVLCLVFACLSGVASADFRDPDMIMAFTKKDAFTNTPFRMMNYDSSYIFLKQRLAHAGTAGRAAEKMSTYSYDGENDAVAKLYVQTAKARGNVVRSYKPQINQIINQNFQKPFGHVGNTQEFCDQDRALIEFDKSGKIVSFLARGEQALGKIAGSLVQYIAIYLGPDNARHLENKLTKRDLEQHFVREL